MKPATTERIRDHAARAEAWKRYALERLAPRVEDAEAMRMDAEMYAIRSENEIRNETIREMERDAREDARGAYDEGYARGRDDFDRGEW
jgi:hypothetical protein